MRRFTTITGALLVLAGCADSNNSIVGPGPSPLPTARNVTSETSSDLWASIITGETGPGSSYQLYMPQQWNGSTVYYAHGIRDVLEPVSLRDQDGFQALREQLGALGYAMAYSSFSENGYAVEDAARRTHQLSGLFASRFGQPERSFLLGHSLGSLAIMQLAEQFPGLYDGVIPICGIAGGTRAQLEYVVNVRALFDVFYPGLLPGTPDAPVPGYVLGPAKQQEIIAAVMANPVGMLVIASTAQTALEFTSVPQMLESLLNALAYHARGADNVLSFTNGKFPVANRNVVYSPRPGLIVPPLTFDALNALLNAPNVGVNARVARFDADPSAAVWAENHFTPSGALQIPTLTLHNRWDRLVPFFHEGLFGERVAAAGATNLLVQRANPAWGYGHCAIPNTEIVQAVTDLRTWVETGIKPNN